jgi:hypothetical protein
MANKKHPKPENKPSPGTAEKRTALFHVYQAVNCQVRTAPDGQTVCEAEFKRLDWTATEMLSEAAIAVMRTTMPDVEITKQNWLKVEKARIVHGVSIVAHHPRIDTNELHRDFFVLGSFMVTQAPLGDSAQVSAARRAAIASLAASSLGDCAGNSVTPAVTLAIDGEMPIELTGQWAEKKRVKRKSTSHEIEGTWDGQRLSTRTLYLQGEKGSIAIAYNERRFAKDLQELLLVVAADPDVRIRAKYETAEQGRSSGNVLVHLEVLPNE